MEMWMGKLTWVTWWLVGLNVLMDWKVVGSNLDYFYIFAKWWKNLETVEIPWETREVAVGVQ